jgi:hypothetical protein
LFRIVSNCFVPPQLAEANGELAALTGAYHELQEKCEVALARACSSAAVLAEQSARHAALEGRFAAVEQAAAAAVEAHRLGKAKLAAAQLERAELGAALAAAEKATEKAQQARLQVRLCRGRFSPTGDFGCELS